MRRRYKSNFPEYVSADEKRARSAQQIKRLQKKNRNLNPIVIDGRAIAVPWWGKEAGVKVADIVQATGLEISKIRSIIVRLKQMGRIESISWGLYRAMSKTKK